MNDLDPEWFSRPIRGHHIFNMILRYAKLQLQAYEGSCCIITSIDEDHSLRERDQEGLRRLIRLFMDAAMELGEDLKVYNDFKLE
jgi:hypothetical protein